MSDDGIQPIEPKAGMDAVAIREKFPNLILIGGMCNAHTLVQGPAEKIEKETRRLIDLGHDAGFIIGSHSIGYDVPLENYLLYSRICSEYGNFKSRRKP